MPFWVLLLITIGMSIAGQLLAPKPEALKPDSELKVPDIDETRPIAVIWGECLITNPQLFWWGDYSAKAITKRIFTGLWFKKVITGYKYSLGMALGLGYSQEGSYLTGTSDLLTIVELQVGEKTLWSGEKNASDDSFIDIDDPEFFGGTKDGGNGGVKAKIEIHSFISPGGGDPTPDAYLQTQLARTPAWKQLTYLVWRGASAGFGYFGNSSSIETIAVKARRYPSFIDQDFSRIGNDANPVDCLMEALANPTWGLGIGHREIDGTLPRIVDMFDADSWALAQETVFDEVNGFSYYWDQQSSFEDVCGMMLRQIDGTVYTDYSTGKLVIKLARADYDVELIPMLDNDDFIEIKSLTRGAWADTINEIKVTYTNAAKNEKNASVTDSDVANFRIQGFETVSTNINYPGCTNETLARQLARRDMRVLTTPLLRFTGIATRAATVLYPGSVFNFSWPEQGIDSVTMRVTKVDLGTLENGDIEIDCTEDKFASAVAIFGNSESEWENPLTGPIAVVYGGIAELPYFFAKDDLNRLYAFAAEPNGAQFSYQWVNDGVVIETDCAFTPTGLLMADLIQLTLTTTGPGAFQVNTLIDAEDIPLAVTQSDIALGAGIIKIDDEWMAYESATLIAGVLTVNSVWRGILDTVPAAHAAGARVWFYSAHLQLHEAVYTDSQAVVSEFLTQTAGGLLTAASAPNYSLTVGGRAHKPYPVSWVKINGSYTGNLIDAGADLVLTWNERNRLTQTDVIDQTASNTYEAGTTVTVRVYDPSNTLLRTVTGLTAATYTYTRAFELADAGSVQASLRFEIDAVRDGLHSTIYKRVVTTAPDGYGFGYGYHYGE